ncbi:Rpn family recombination-promoting nuclease/putative transposase [Cysteiniphilum sp. 6C5]|uniref:Rpn family recombination-promoting nuclease/putative transposase n=1 Tax=unclassified Cysteiniphilum TaxID=2610889 RepID=UPI003F82D5C7
MGAHDLQFRKAFSDPNMFKVACEIYLPEDIKKKLNFSTLKLRQMSGAFIRNLIILQYNIDPDKDAKLFEQLKEEIGDIVYSCETYDNAEVLLIAHSEHQSTPDKHYPLRNALYDISALKDFVETEKPDKYPLAVSFLAYHGKPSPYPYSTDIIENFEHQELAQKYFLKPVLIDYRQSADEELLEHGEISGLEIALKHTFDEQVDDSVIKNLMQGLQKCTKIELRRDWWMYALRSWETSADTMIKEYKETLNEEETFVMTAAQQLVERGELKGKQETARNLLAFGDSSDKVAKVTGLDLDTILKLRNEIDSKTQH